MNLNMQIRDPDLQKLVEKADTVTPEMFFKLVLIVDNSLNIMKRNQANDQANNTGIALKRVIDLETTVNTWRAEMLHERELRAQADLERAQKDVQLAQQRINLSTDARLEVKRILAESLQTEVGEVLEDKQEATRIARRKWWSDTLSALGRAVIIAVGVPIALGTFVAIILFLAKVFKVAI